MTPPPPLQVFLYRLVGWRLGPAHREWVYADLTSKRWVLRQCRVVVPVVAGLMALVFAATGSSVARMLFPVLAVMVLFVALRNPLMVRALTQQGLTLDGEPDPRATWYDDDQARHSRNVSGALTIGVVFVAGLVYLAVTGD